MSRARGALIAAGLALAASGAAIAATVDPSAGAPPAGHASLDPQLLGRTLRDAAALPRLHTLLVAREGVPLVERAFRGPGLDAPASIKSISKSIVSMLVGVAIERDVLDGVAQRIAPFFPDRLPHPADPRLGEVTIDHLLSMRAGLERTSGRNYGRWVQSADWVRFALSRRFVDEPGGRMLYSTGSTHLLSAILTRASGRSTLAIARDWLARPLGVTLAPWQRDPQGVYLGGNNMTLSPRALLRFGELYRNGGVHDGRRILTESWVRESWTPRTRSPFSGDRYGYGWFITEICGRAAYYARGFGGQYVFVIPALAMTVVITSNPHVHSRVDGYRDRLHALIDRGLVPAAMIADDAAHGDAAQPCGAPASATPHTDGPACASAPTCSS